MASSKPIKGSQLIAKDFTKDARDSIDKLNKDLNTTEAIIKAIGDTAEKSLKSLKAPTDSSGLRKRNEQLEILKKSTKGLTDIEKQRIRLGKQLKDANSSRIDQNEVLKVQLTTQRKVNKELARETLGLVGAYEKQSKKLIDLRKRFKDIVLVEGESSKAAIKLRKEITKLDSKLKKVDASAGQFQRNVGNYPKLFRSATSALTSFVGAFGLTAGITGFVSVFKGVIETNREFNKSVSELSSITGATGKDLQFYKEQAADIGATTTLSATQAVDAFKLIGSQRPELLQNAEALAAVTREAVILAEASGLELPISATALTTSLNQMNEAADQSSRFINILAAGSKEGAADIPFLNKAIEKSGAVARDANLSFEQLVAGIETIAPSVSEPSSAGLKFANILLRLQENGKGFESGQFDLKDALTQVKSEFDAMGDPIAKAQAETKLFGKESIVVGKALINNIDTFENFTTSVTGTNTALEQQRVNVDNLDGDIKEFDSTLEAVSLRLSGEGGFFRSVVQATTALLGFLLPTKSLGNETQKLTKDFEDQEEVLNPLLERYDELKDLGELNTEQQAELEGVINDIVEIVPDAATGFDVYGNALDINRDKVIANTEAQRDLLAELAGQDIEDIGESFLSATKDITIYQEQLEKGVRQSAELQKITGELRRDLTVPEARTAAVDIRNLDSQIQENIQTLIKFGLTQEEIIDLFDKSGRSNKEQEKRFLENLNAVIALNKAKVEEAKLDKDKIDTTGDDIKIINDLIEKQRELLKVAKAKDGSTEANIASRNREIDVINEEIKRLQALGKEKESQRKTDAQIQKERQARFDIDFERNKQREEEEQSRLDAAEERQRKRNEANTAAATKKAEEAAAEEARLAAERKELLIGFTDDITEAGIEASNRLAEARREDNEDEIARRESNLANLEQLSKEGQQITEGQRAFEAQKLADAQVEKRRLEEQEKNRQLAIGVAKAFNSALESEEPAKALLTALATTGAEGLIVNSLFTGGAYDGADSIDESNSMFKIPGRDPYLVPLRKGEMVLTPEEQAKSGISKRSDIHDAIAQNNLLKASMLYNPQLSDTGVTMNSVTLDNSAVVSELKAVRKAISGQEQNGGVSVGAMNQLVDKRIKEAMSKVISHYGSNLTSPGTRSRG